MFKNISLIKILDALSTLFPEKFYIFSWSNPHIVENDNLKNTLPFPRNCLPCKFKIIAEVRPITEKERLYTRTLTYSCCTYFTLNYIPDLPQFYYTNYLVL